MAGDFLDALIDSPDAAENAPRMAIIAVQAPALNSIELDFRGKCASEVAKLNLSAPFIGEDGRLVDGQYQAAYVAAKIRRVERKYARAISTARGLGQTATMESFTEAWKGQRK
jgi:hypothetical protein